jgi:hypothetical protein
MTDETIEANIQVCMQLMEVFYKALISSSDIAGAMPLNRTFHARSTW